MMDELSSENVLSPVDVLADPAADGGEGIQALGMRHARLFVRANVWRRPSIWTRPLRNLKVLDRYAILMYCRVVRHYGLQVPLPDDTQPIDPVWFQHDPATSRDVLRETEAQLLARMLYTAAFSGEIFFHYYLSHYVCVHSGRWNRRVSSETKLARESEGVLHSLEEIAAWARGKAYDDEVGITLDDLFCPFANCHNERDGFRVWSFCETYAENSSRRYPLPSELQEVMRQIDLAYPNHSVTAGELLSILAFYQ